MQGCGTSRKDDRLDIAVFPGTFHPVTAGHMDIIRRGAAMFGMLVVAVAAQHGKAGALPADERAELLRLAIGAEGISNVRVEIFDGLVVDFAARVGARCILRGLRNTADFLYEQPMAQLNRGLRAEVETLCLMSAPEVAYISSSRVREIAALGGDISGLVPQALQARIAAIYGSSVTDEGSRTHG